MKQYTAISLSSAAIYNDTLDRVLIVLLYPDDWLMITEHPIPQNYSPPEDAKTKIFKALGVKSLRHILDTSDNKWQAIEELAQADGDP